MTLSTAALAFSLVLGQHAAPAGHEPAAAPATGSHAQADPVVAPGAAAHGEAEPMPA